MGDRRQASGITAQWHNGATALTVGAGVVKKKSPSFNGPLGYYRIFQFLT